MGREIDLVTALDVSGSVSDAEIAEFVGEVNALKGTLRARITLLACDQELSSEGPKVFEPWETLEPPTQGQRWRWHFVSPGLRMGEPSGPNAGPAAVFHGCPGPLPGCRTALPGAVAGQGPCTGAVGRENPVELIAVLAEPDLLRMNVLLTQPLQAVRINESRMCLEALTDQGEARVPLHPNTRPEYLPA